MEIKDDLRRRNGAVLMQAIPLTFFVSLFLYLASYFMSSLRMNRTLYAFMLVALVVLLWFYCVSGNRRPELILPTSYGFLTILYLFAILLSAAVNRQIPATIFCVVLFAGPLLFADKPYRMAVYLTVVTVVFCVTSVCFKDWQVCQMDIANSVSILILSVAINTYLLQDKMQTLVHERKTERERDTDGLTQLFVKKAAEREIRDYISRTKKDAVLIIIDLDNFKTINDTKGHAYGDMVLRATGECLKEVFPDGDILGRFGGDEFIVFMEGESRQKAVREFLERFQEKMREATMSMEERGVTQSIGAAMYPIDGEEFESLFEHADQAVYEAKRRGKAYTQVKIAKSSF